MALKGKILAQGKISSSRLVLYTVTLQNAVARVKFFSISNTDPDQVCLTVWASEVAVVGQGYAITPVDMVLAGGDTVYLIDDGQEMDLPNGSSIQAIASKNNVLEFTLTGEEGPS